MKILRPDQTKFISDICAAFETRDSDGQFSNHAILAQAPTGMGKTVCAAALTRQVLDHSPDSSVMLLVHREELFLQTAATLCELGAQPQPIASNRVLNVCGSYLRVRGEAANEQWRLGDKRSPITLGTIGSMSRLLAKGLAPPAPSFIIVDEAHHSAARTWRLLIEHYLKHGSWLVGFTATPERADGLSLMARSGGIYDKLVLGPSIRSLVDSQDLAYPDIYAPSEAQIDLSHVKKVAGEFDREETSRRAITLIGGVLAHYNRLVRGRGPCLVFCVNIEHARRVAEEFRGANVRAASIEGNMKEDERADLIAAIGDGRLDVLTSCEIISEGLDVPGIYAVIMLRPTLSLTVFRQQIGRGMRPFPGKTKTIVIDHVGNTQRHGNPMEEPDWKVDGRTKSEREENARSRVAGILICQKPGCGAVNDPSDFYCRVCNTPLQKTTIVVQEQVGELVRLQSLPATQRVLERIWGIDYRIVNYDMFIGFCQEEEVPIKEHDEVWGKVKNFLSDLGWKDTLLGESANDEMDAPDDRAN